MRPLLIGIFALAAQQGLARADASGDPPWPTLYRHFSPSFTGDPKVARAAVASIIQSCRFSSMSRIGPSQAEEARCDRAERRALALGTDGAQAAFAFLDLERVGGGGAHEHLYDLIGRSGDPRAIEPLVAALERIKAGGDLLVDRQWESTAMGATLRALTFHHLGGDAPWNDQYANAPGWRAWVNAHRGMTHAALVAARTVEARRQKADHDSAVAVAAAQFLALQQATRAEGLAALDAIARRGDLEENLRADIENVRTMKPIEARDVPDDRKV